MRGGEKGAAGERQPPEGAKGAAFPTVSSLCSAILRRYFEVGPAKMAFNAHVHAGDEAMEGGDAEGALAAYDEAARLDPKSAEAHMGRGGALHRLGRDREALEALDAAVGLDRSHDALLLRGAVHAALSQPALAARDFGSAAAERPDSVEAHLGIGVACEEMGRHKRALAAVGRAIKISPGDPALRIARGRVLVNAGLPGGALAEFGAALRLDGSLAEAHAGRGSALLAAGRRKKALAAYSRAGRLDPGSAEAHLGRGIALYEVGRHGLALAALGRAAALDPGSATAGLYRGRALRGLGRREEALEELDAAVAADPGGAAAIVERAEILGEMGRHEEALEALDGAADQDRRDVCRARGTALSGLGRGKEAAAADAGAAQTGRAAGALRPSAARC